METIDLRTLGVDRLAELVRTAYVGRALTIPTGWKWSGEMRCVKAGEHYLANGSALKANFDTAYLAAILVPATRKAIKFVERIENGKPAVRQVKYGEWVETGLGCIEQWEGLGSSSAYRIFDRIDEEVPVA